ncbi:creatininase family protein [Kocuria palustris]|jgi:creatinine amidohydrolase|uniref:Creatinine amidohydrolase n=1 Tax=Kocuria palustris PEL TaxID=1236550 RepID=M2YE34_9MICC|nr:MULTISPECIES: creatininase family protein [Kocuria]EME36864.1 Creatinine amidohydrolase [Kocuria palustris PEL]MBN6753779.1 creatininase family protein [Kocuria palustris]MBN6758971.1 creatininase family protein [Kocuria palustris]MBN6764022.1 creatininase family protein [Kocuria palustris]MBN6783539.1 creatininase family protein [Kocuria palustris]
MSPTATRLAEMTSAEAAASAQAGRIVVLPVGALEQHGPAMPLGTDTYRADAVAERVVSRLPDDAVLGPTLPIGVSPHHLGFPGTVSLTTRTFTALVREIAVGLHRQGFHRILVVTGHGGNNASLTTIAQDLLASDPDLEFAWTPLTSVAADIVRSAGVSAVHGHCGEAETAQMLEVAPDLVRRDLLEPGPTRPEDLDPLSALARSVSHPTLTRSWDDLTPNGVLGDPRQATEQLGAELIETITERICDFLGRWAQL